MLQTQRTRVAGTVEEVAATVEPGSGPPPAGRAGRAASRLGPTELTALESSYAGQIATAVWLGKLSDEGAREALLSYAIACHLCEGTLVIRLRAALLAEYRHWRERQDLAS